MHKIVLASKSKVRKKILNTNGIYCEVFPSNIDEDTVKKSLLKQNASPEIISKNLAELKANKISAKFIDKIGLKEHLSPTRANGLVSMIKQIKIYALAFKNKIN